MLRKGSSGESTFRDRHLARAEHDTEAEGSFSLQFSRFVSLERPLFL